MEKLAKPAAANVYYLIDKMKYLVIFVFLIGVCGCSKSDTATIPQEKMVDLIYDLTISTSARTVSSKRDSIQYEVSANDILKKYGVDSLAFAKAQAYYLENVEEGAVVLDSVQARIKKKIEETKALPPDKSEEAGEGVFKRLRKLDLITE